MSGRDWDEKDKQNDPMNLLKEFKKVMEGDEQKYKIELYVTASQMIQLAQFIKTVLHMKCPDEHK